MRTKELKDFIPELAGGPDWRVSVCVCVLVRACVWGRGWGCAEGSEMSA